MSGFKKLLISFVLIDLLVIVGGFTIYSLWQQQQHDKIARTQVALNKYISEHQADIDYIFTQPGECEQNTQPATCQFWPESKAQRNRLFGDSDRFGDMLLVELLPSQGTKFVYMLDLMGISDVRADESIYGENPVSEVIPLLEGKRAEPAHFEKIKNGVAISYTVFPYRKDGKIVGGIAIEIDKK